MCFSRSHSRKGYKFLDVSSGRVYISRDVVFDENDFPFSQLHSNAGARLRAEISLLPTIFYHSHLIMGENILMIIYLILLICLLIVLVKILHKI